MADTVYTHGIAHLVANGWTGADARVLFLDAAGSYVVDKDHASLTDLSLGANELATTGYARVALASETATENATDDQLELDATDATWTALGPNTGGPSIQAAVVYFHVDGTDANDVPFLYLDTGFPKQVNGEDLTLHWNLAGLARIHQP